ncbi:MAG: LamB/YcsF family protein [Treponema sp.]|jgi:UPF0271 protein|nr:LamB/YcsF family protein [Treponema sp.]
MYSIDLNCDLGESFGSWTKGLDDQIIPLITSANVACGFHASDPDVMARTVHMAKTAGIAVGAHPGYPDIQGFGRRAMKLSPEEAKHAIMYQTGALAAFAAAEGIKLQHVKPHGALYNAAGSDYELAKAIAAGIKAVDPDLILLGLSGSCMLQAAEECGLRCVREVFADRAYEEDGSLVSRGKKGAIITDENVAVARVLRMIQEQKVMTITGTDIPITAESICVHGDNDYALAFVKKIRAALEKEQIRIKAFGA